MDTMELTDAVQSDVSEALSFSDQLDNMTKSEMIKLADNEFGYTIDSKLKIEVIKENLLRIDAARKSEAKKENEESLKMTVNESDPEIQIRFFNMESPGADLEFAYSGEVGMFGENNPKGYKKCPKYHLFPGEVVKLAYSVYEHLNSKTFVTHKTVWDVETGMIKGNIPIIKPRFILQPIFSKEQLLKLNK